MIAPHYLHAFDSLSDFSSENLAVFPSDANGPLYQGDATMSGGVYGWYFGLWSGYYAWDKTLLGVASTTSSGESRPPYSAAMSPNLNPDGSTGITTSGRDYPLPVGSNAWIGSVSSYSDVSMNADLTTTTTQYTFAAFVDGDQVSIDRNGGDAYYRVPRGSGSGGGNLPFIRTSHTSATDVNGSIGIAGLGGSFSRSASTSWQYQGFMDMNGDRYPDLVSFPDSSSGNASFTVTEGSGQGFGGGNVTFGLPGGGHLARYDTVSYGFGASLSSSSGGMSQASDTRGRPKSIQVEKPEPSSGSGIGANVGLNGTYGASVQSEGFFDVNGDGLPDYVSESGAGDYVVALNQGSGTFAPAVDWGSGMSEETFQRSGLPADLVNTTQGISMTGTGSFGASGGISVGVGGFSIGVSGGFNATVNQTYSTLSDVNGDGLPD